MSKFEFKLPDIGEGVSEGEIVSWLVKVGDNIAEDQDMVEVMTDKATVTIGAPRAGVVAQINAQEGDTVPVGEVIVVLETDGAGAAPEPAAAEAPAASAAGDIKDELPGTGALVQAPAQAPAPAVAKSAAPATGDYFNDKPLAAPATRKLARELGVDIQRVPPTGEAGRVTREDVERFAAGGGVVASSAAAAPAIAPVPAAAPVPVGAAEERIPIRGMRKRTYESMARSVHTAAHFTYVDECECTELRALRGRLKSHAEAALAALPEVVPGVGAAKLSFLPFIVKAVVAALKRHPIMNSLVDDTSKEIVMRKTYDIGIAVATPAGLIVPVLRGADRMTLVDIAQEIWRLAHEARIGKTRREDLGGSSFTITSLGKLGGLMATPVVNYPEVGILFVPEMKKRPVVKNDEIVVGHVMDLSLSFDHRIIDGADGAAFTNDVIGMLQSPDQLLVNM